MLDALAVTLTGTGARMADAGLSGWEDGLRLNPANDFNTLLAEDPEARAAMGAMMEHIGPAMENIGRLRS